MADARLDIEITTTASKAERELRDLRLESARAEVELERMKREGRDTGEAFEALSRKVVDLKFRTKEAKLAFDESRAALDRLNDEAANTGSSASSLGGQMAAMRDAMMGPVAAAKMVIDGIAAIASEIDSLVSEAAQADRAMASLTSVLRSTGGVAGLSAMGLTDLAEELHKTTLFEDDMVLASEAVMLTFKRIGAEVFPEAIRASADMAQVMGMDLQSAVVMVGKALNEPIEGIGALRRVGVQLTDQQEAMVGKFMAANDVMSAQSVILGELQSEFGGAAKAAGDLATSGIDKLKKSWGDLREEIGKSLADAFSPMITGITAAVEATTAGIIRIRMIEGKGKPEGLAPEDSILWERRRQEIIQQDIEGYKNGTKRIETFKGAPISTQAVEIQKLEAQLAQSQGVIRDMQRIIQARPATPIIPALPGSGGGTGTSSTARTGTVEGDWERATGTNWQKGDADVKAYLAKVVADYQFGVNVLKQTTEEANTTARSDILRVIETLRSSTTNAWASPADTEVVALVNALQKYPEPVAAKRTPAEQAAADANDYYDFKKQTTDFGAMAAQAYATAMNAKGVAAGATPSWVSNWAVDPEGFNAWRYAQSMQGQDRDALRYSAWNQYFAEKGASPYPSESVTRSAIEQRFFSITKFENVDEYLKQLRSTSETLVSYGLQTRAESNSSMSQSIEATLTQLLADPMFTEDKNESVLQLIKALEALTGVVEKSTYFDPVVGGKTPYGMNPKTGQQNTPEEEVTDIFNKFQERSVAISSQAGIDAMAGGFAAIGEALAGSTEGLESFGQALADLSAELVATISKLAITAGLKAIVANPADVAGWTLLAAGVAGSLASGAITGATKHYAEGTNYHPGGVAIVGERGPELVQLPMGSAVIPNRELGGSSIVVNVINASRAQVDAEVEETKTARGSEYRVVLRDAVVGLVATGALDKSLASRYGVRSLPRRVN